MLCKICLIEMFPYASRRVASGLASEAAYTAFETANSLSVEHFSQSDFNFIEGNGIETEIVLSDPTSFGNYLLVMDGEKIISRWFVIEKTRTTNYAANQYRLQLRRDVLADFPLWLETPAFIQKGTITDNLSPLLFNKEEMTFNSIKRREILLPDETGMPWIVGYIARNATLTDSAKDLNGAVAVFPTSDDKAAPNALSFDTLDELYKALGLPNGANSFTVIQSAVAKVNVVQEYPNTRRFALTATKDLAGIVGYNASAFTNTKTYSASDPSALVGAMMDKVDVSSLLSEVLGTVMPPKAFVALGGFMGRTVYIASARTNYSLEITPTASQVPVSKTFTPNSGTSLFSSFDASVASSGTGITDVSGTWQTGSFAITYVATMTCRVTLTPLASGAVQVSLTDPALRPHLKDAPYDMFCIPYGSRPIVTSQGTIRSSRDLAWAAAVALVENLASGTYDLQLLPYCPAREMMASKNPDDPTLEALNAADMTVDYAFKGTVQRDSSGQIASFERTGEAAVPIIWCSESTFSFMLSPDLTDDFAFPPDPTEVKVRNETSKARLVSPNLAGGFDFSPMMNGGCSTFRVDCTYRPFNPYIHIAPVFAHMYGGDFKDARGLVCGGDFSLPRITDAWESYQQNNKNYQAVFDREIQNLEVTQKYQRVTEVFGGIAGVGQGALAGAMAGSVVPGIGTAIGAGVGAVASAAGGIADLVMGDAMRAEAVDYRKDLFGYQLGNIRALPYSLAKSAAQNANNRPYPFIEVYRASDEETQALRDKIEYDGMTVGVIGKAEDYAAGYPCFLQGLMTGPHRSGADSDLWNAIASEFAKGCYLYKEA